jgi:hypothetical protein
VRIEESAHDLWLLGGEGIVDGSVVVGMRVFIACSRALESARYA